MLWRPYCSCQPSLEKCYVFLFQHLWRLEKSKFWFLSEACSGARTKNILFELNPDFDAPDKFTALRSHEKLAYKPVLKSFLWTGFGNTWKGMLCSGTTFLFSRTTTVLPTTSRYEYLICKIQMQNCFSCRETSALLCYTYYKWRQKFFGSITQIRGEKTIIFTWPLCKLFQRRAYWDLSLS